MSDYDRGAYTPPTETPLSFDARQPVRGSRPVPWTLILSLVILLGIAAAIFFFYQSGARQSGQAPQTVGDTVGDIRTAAPPEAQVPDPAEGLQIYKSETDEAPEGAPAFAPPPEAPQARPTAPVAVNQLPPTAPAKPAPAPAPAPVAKAPAAPAPAPKVVALPKVAPPPKAAPAPAVVAQAPAPKAPAAAGGPASVQIGAFSSQSLADKGWNDAAGVAPGAAAGKGKRVERVEREDGTVLFRTAVTGFSSRADAQAFCGQLKAAGKTCFVR